MDNNAFLMFLSKLKTVGATRSKSRRSNVALILPSSSV